MEIAQLTAREILDSNAHPTLEVTLVLDDDSVYFSSVPSGTSTGAKEACELRDHDERYGGLGVLKAVANVEHEIAHVVVGMDPTKLFEIDNLMIEADGTPQKTKLGANAILAVSKAIARAGAGIKGEPLFQHLADLSGFTPAIPHLQMLMMEGASHGNWVTDIQEFMIIPQFNTIHESLVTGVKVFESLRVELAARSYPQGVGMEGAFVPNTLGGNTEALRLIQAAFDGAKLNSGSDVLIALDVAGSGLIDKGKYFLHTENRKLDKIEWVSLLYDWLRDFPIASIEDPFDQEDWELWQEFNDNVGEKIMVVGDDLTVTNSELIKRAASEKSCSAVIIKPNQIGTVSETISAIKTAREAKMKIVVSHRSGETTGDFIADLAVGVGADYAKFGAPQHGERLAKYNRLLYLESLL